MTVDERLNALEALVLQIDNNDRVTQDVCKALLCKALLQAVAEIAERLNKFDPPPS